MKRILIYALGFTSLLGCRSTESVSLSDEASIVDVNRWVDKTKTRVVLDARQWLPAVDLRISRDSIFWVHPSTGTSYRFATDRIEYLEIIDSRNGSIAGTAMGVATGAILGYLLTRSTGKGCAPVNSSSANVTAFVAVTCSVTSLAIGRNPYRTVGISVLIGGLVGKVLGRSRGWKRRIRVVKGPVASH